MIESTALIDGKLPEPFWNCALENSVLKDYNSDGLLGVPVNLRAYILYIVRL